MKKIINNIIQEVVMDDALFAIVLIGVIAVGIVSLFLVIKDGKDEGKKMDDILKQ